MMRNEEREVERFIRKHGMIGKGDVVIAGVSGGADSVCLLFVLCALRERLGFQIKACHVNHGLRGVDADADEAYVRQLCRELEVPCRVFHKDVELIARNRKQSPEEAGRTARREAFGLMCREDGGTKIATAHHRDDNAETVLWNMARGTGLKGLGGIRPAAGKWIRPLLALTRAQTEGYLRAKGISWCEDATNSGDDYTRNRIRHNILPVLEEQVNPGAARHLDELSRQAREVWDYLEQGVDRAWENCVEGGNIGRSAGCGTVGDGGDAAYTGEAWALEINGEAFRKEAPAVQKQLIRRCLAYVRGQERDIGVVHIAALAELFHRQAGRALDLPGGIKAERTYDGVRLKQCSKAGGNMQEPDNGGGFMIPLKVPGKAKIPDTGQSIVCRIIENADISEAEEIPQKSYTKWFDYDIIKYGLSARTRQSGDYLIIDEKGSRQKLKSFFVNEKIPREERKRMLLIADGEHIIWIPGYRMSRACHISSRTKTVLEIKITEEKENGRDDQGADSRRQG